MKPGLDCFLDGEMGSYVEAGMIDLDYFNINSYTTDLSTAGYRTNPYARPGPKAIFTSHSTYGPYDRARTKAVVQVSKKAPKMTKEEEYIDYILRDIQRYNYRVAPIIHVKRPPVEYIFRGGLRRGRFKKPRPMEHNIPPIDFIMDLIFNGKNKRANLNLFKEYDRQRERESHKPKQPLRIANLGMDYKFNFKYRFMNEWWAFAEKFYIESVKDGRRISFDYLDDDSINEACADFVKLTKMNILIHSDIYRNIIINKLIELCVRPIILNYNIPDYSLKIGLVLIRGKIIPVIGLADKDSYKFIEVEYYLLPEIHQHVPYRIIAFNSDSNIKKSIEGYFLYYHLGECHQSLIDLCKTWWAEAQKFIKYLSDISGNNFRGY